jgi:hypothetical protein
MANLFFDVHPSKAKQTLFCEGNYFLIKFTVSAYSVRQMLLRVAADSIVRSSRKALFDHRRLRFDIEFHRI